MRITIAQINPKIGDINENLKKIIDIYKKALTEKSDLVIYPELSITGYSPLDMVENERLIKNNIDALKTFSRIVKDTAAVIGFIDFNNGYGKKLLNSVAFIHKSKVKHIFYKNLLPTYDIFDEKRYFEPKNNYKIINYNSKKILITICEDIWSQTDLLPDKNLYAKNIIQKFNPQIIINLSASPYYYGKATLRKKILENLSISKNASIIYVNQVGANDDLIFDGNSMYINKKNFLKLKEFAESYITIDTDKRYSDNLKEDISFIENAIILGIRDYFQKQGFKKTVIGLSGGIDSSIVAALCVKAIGNENVHGILMPSKFTSKQSIYDAKKLAKNLNIKYDIIPINAIFQSYLKELNLDKNNIDITIQNIQSRIRGNILMSYSNKYGYLVSTTSNKSEISMGYFTLYGDSCGAIAPIGDLLKTDVYKLANHINKEKEIIPNSIIKRPPTAELKPDQKDQDDLPAYETLDNIIKLYIEEQQSIDHIIKKVGNKKLVIEVIKRIERNEYKRRQLPILFKLSKKAFGFGRRFPIVKEINL